MRRVLLGLFGVMAVTAATAGAVAQEQQRVALVIGNGSYRVTRALATPPNDANDLAAALEGLGFDVVKVVNGDKYRMERAIRNFGLLAADADVALMYYAGHSLQVAGTNYMVPTTAKLAEEQDLDFEAVAMDLPLRAMERSGAAVRIVILDAGRDNPMSQILAKSIHDAGRSTAVGQGLAEVRIPERTLVAYATAPGRIAPDGKGRNSPFAAALVRWIGQPGREIGQMFRRVGREVFDQTGGEQVPWVIEALLGDFYFAGDTKSPGATPPRPAPLALEPEPELEPVEAIFVAVKNTNVRKRPSVRSPKVAVLKRGSEIHVAGKVVGANWYLVERDEEPLGYVFGELLGEPERAAEPTPLRAGETLPRDCEDCPELVVVPAGRFTMGAPMGEQGRDDDEGPRHPVAIPQAFALGRYEVTRAEFAAFVRDSGQNPQGCYVINGEGWRNDSSKGWRDPGFKQSARDPVVCVSWRDAKAYVGWLSRKTGREYRLPSESEWEYAARSGTTTARYWGADSDRACKHENVYDEDAESENELDWPEHDCEDGSEETAPVGSFRANGFRLRDMLGNVREWVEDCWNPGYADAPGDGSAWTTGMCERRVLRGGSWSSPSRLVRAAGRGRFALDFRFQSGGFRVARTLP